MTDLVHEVRQALQQVETTRRAYEDGARLARTQEDEIALWRAWREARKAQEKIAPAWLAGLCQTVEALEQERDHERANAKAILRKYEEAIAEADRLEARVAQAEQLATKMLALLDEEYHAHRDPDSSQYNSCDARGQCMYCDKVDEFRAALASGRPQETPNSGAPQEPT